MISDVTKLHHLQTIIGRQSPTHGLRHAPQSSVGLSLIELMVALFISTLILVGLIQIFTSTRTTYQADEGLARLQESGRFAIDFLAYDIRGAGNMGCIGNIPPTRVAEFATNYLKTSDAPFDLARGGIEGFEATGTGPGPGATYSLVSMYPPPMVASTTPALTNQLIDKVAQGSDVLVIRKMSDNAVNLVSPYNESAQLFAESGTFTNEDKDKIFIVTDCTRASIFQATAVSSGGGKTNFAHAAGGSPGNICPRWGESGCPGTNYKEGAQIAEFSTTVYYVGVGAGGDKPSLFRRTWPKGAPFDTELVEGIENLQILYGVNTDGDSQRTADMYLPANLLPVDATGRADWARVVSARISMLVGSSNVREGAGGSTDLQLDDRTYILNGVEINPADDGRWRRVFTTTVELRNRHP